MRGTPKAHVNRIARLDSSQMCTHEAHAGKPVRSHGDQQVPGVDAAQGRRAPFLACDASGPQVARTTSNLSLWRDSEIAAMEFYPCGHPADAANTNLESPGSRF
jgi:hypothetical protein